MSVTYHKAYLDRTVFVPSRNETELNRTPAMDGFRICSGRRASNGNVHWRLIWPDFACFLGVADSEIRKHAPYDRPAALAEAAAAKGYDPLCVKALGGSSTKMTLALRSAVALGFDPIYLWPATASKWPTHYQRIASDNAQPSSTPPSGLSWLDRVGETSANNRPASAAVISLTDAIASAESFTVAVDCLPVGKDIRNRLQAHVRAHIELLRRIGGDPA